MPASSALGTSGLDVETTLEVLDALADLQDRCDLAVVLVSHDLAAVSHLADRVAVMREGAILEVGDVGLLRRNPDHPYTADLFAARPALPTDGTLAGGFD